jgi:hypothetical protein
MRSIIENLACACFGWSGAGGGVASEPEASNSIQKFLDHLEEHYVHAPLSAGDKALHNLTQPPLIECLQKYDPHLRRAFLRATKGNASGCNT